MAIRLMPALDEKQCRQYIESVNRCRRILFRHQRAIYTCCECGNTFDVIINDNLLSDFNCSAVTDWTKMLLVCNFCVITKPDENIVRVRSSRTTQSVSVVLRPQGQSDLDTEILASASKRWPQPRS